jgi:flagella basal body P-ring formation protein FlgA
MTQKYRLLFAFWLVIACSVGSAQPCSASIPVTLHNEVEVRGTTVKLSDIFGGVPTDIDREIAQAPAPGKQVTYDVTVLNRIADKYRLEWQAHSATDHVTVTTAASRITADAIRDAVVQKVKDNSLVPNEKNSTVDVSFDNHALQIDLPADHTKDFTLNNFDYDPTSKHFHSDLVAETSSGPFSVPVSGRITVKRNVPVLTKHLEGGAVIGKADIDWMEIPDERLNGTVVTDINELIGRELRHDADEGEPLHAHDVIPQRLVIRGSLVTMKIETPIMQVTAQGKALMDGTEGDVIRVLNTQSNRTIEGTVTGPGTVTIHTAQQLAAVQ